VANFFICYCIISDESISRIIPGIIMHFFVLVIDVYNSLVIVCTKISSTLSRWNLVFLLRAVYLVYCHIPIPCIHFPEIRSLVFLPCVYFLEVVRKFLCPLSLPPTGAYTLITQQCDIPALIYTVDILAIARISMLVEALSRNRFFFFRFEYHMFYVLYPFVTCFLTLPHNITDISIFLILISLIIFGFFLYLFLLFHVAVVTFSSRIVLDLQLTL
jgi:hypothetical protein